MIKTIIRIVTVIAFVVSTMASPLHALAMPLMNHANMQMPAAHMDTSATMSDDCAKAMGIKVAPKAEKKTGDSSKNDCCHDGCHCPLSHCPATLIGILPSVAPAFLGRRAASPLPPSQSMHAYLADMLERPPRA